MTPQLPPGRFDEFRAFLKRRGFSFEDRPYQVFMARADRVVVNLYQSGKVVLGGSDDLHLREIRFFLDKMGATGAAPEAAGALSRVSGTRIGLDEVGKGDYFGPLVVAGVLATAAQVDTLRDAGVRDSKGLGDEQIVRVAGDVARILPKGQVRTVVIGPERYNAMHADMGSVNVMLGWAHAKALEELLGTGVPCDVAVVDKFGDERHIRSRLGERGRAVHLIQVPRGEREMAVAAASVVARARFLRALDEMSEAFGVRFPKGATHVEDFARRLVADKGPDVLQKTAKVHFRTTGRVLRK